MLSLSELVDEIPELAAPGTMTDLFLIRDEKPMLLFKQDRGDQKRLLPLEALLTRPEDLAFVDYEPEFTTAQQNSLLFGGGNIAKPKDEEQVVKKVLANLDEVNRSLTFDVFTKEVNGLLSQFRGLKHPWKQYKGRLYYALNASSVEIFLANLHSSFFIPKMLIARDNMEGELAASTPADPEEKHANTMLSIDYNGLLIPLPDGTFLIPPYRAFELQSIEVKNDVIHLHLLYKEELEEEAVFLSEEQIEWLQRRARVAYTKEGPVGPIHYQFSTIRDSYARMFR